MWSLDFALAIPPQLQVVRVNKKATPALLVQLNALLTNDKMRMNDEPKSPKMLQRIISLLLTGSPYSTSTAVVYLRQCLGGITLDILPHVSAAQVPNPPPINPLARRQHQKPLFLLLSLILQRLQIHCPEDLRFMILDYVTSHVVVNGRICALAFDVEGGSAPGGSAP